MDVGQFSFSDVQAPVFANGCPPNQQLFSGPLESPVTVTWLDPVVTDNDGQNVTLTSSVAKGSSLGPGVHVVRLTAADVSGNHASCNFVISVQGTPDTAILLLPFLIKKREEVFSRR